MQLDARFRKVARTLLLVCGVLLMTIGTLEAMRVPLAYYRAARGVQATMSKPLADITLTVPPPAQVTSSRAIALYPHAAPPGQQPQTGVLIGHLTIPRLKLDAPITEGTPLSVLAHSAGHLATSVLPGEVGTTVIAAHDVTYFHHIDALQAGDTITVQTAQGMFTYRVSSHSVIHVGHNVVNTPYPSLVLETCYPLTALTLVDRRYIVTAVLVKSHLTTPAN